jgi:chromosome segregation ATPase
MENNTSEKPILKMGSLELEEIDIARDEEVYSEQLDDLLKESSEINELSQELNHLIDSQQESLDNAEKNIENTNTHIDKSNNHLTEASQHQDSVFKNKSALLTICTATAGGAGVALAGPKVAIACAIGAFGFGLYGLFF